MPSLGDLKRRREEVRKRRQNAISARKQVRKVPVPSGARGRKKKLLVRLTELARSLAARVRKLTGRIRRKREQRKKFDISPGYPHYGGCRYIIENEVIPVAKKYGVPVTSRKRPANHPLSISNPGSDHNEANTYADAVDLGTYNGQALAHAIAKALGISGFSTGNYNHYFIQRRGHTFRVQILWAVSGHFDHVHVGIKRVS